MLRHAACAVILAVAVQAPTPPSGPFPLEEVTAAQLQEWMTSGRYTARQIAEM
jgi:hypothetical protein